MRPLNQLQIQWQQLFGKHLQRATQDICDEETWPDQPNHSDLPIKTKSDSMNANVQLFRYSAVYKLIRLKSYDQSKCAIDIQEMEKEKLCTYFLIFNISLTIEKRKINREVFGMRNLFLTILKHFQQGINSFFWQLLTFIYLTIDNKENQREVFKTLTWKWNLFLAILQHFQTNVLSPLCSTK